jgi:hypothetical protein
VRQLAAVLIRRKVQKAKQWNGLHQDVRQGYKKPVHIFSLNKFNFVFSMWKI